MSYKAFCFTVLILLTDLAFGQKNTTFVKSFTVSPNDNLQSERPVTAVAARSESYLGNSITLKVNKETLEIPFDPDGEDYTYFLSLSNPMNQADISSNDALEIFLINSGSSPEIDGTAYRVMQDCEFQINPIPQNQWRSGLAAPSFSRSFTEVSHVIIHHSAGSNTNTNYTQVVRDIYLYHTQVNGWSDIGYNYLVAQNGDLYAGRDPDGGMQDNVLGAHFCGRNATTMGICMLGNYETATATNSAWSTLQQVASFKINKEELDPMGFTGHPLGNIGHIAGHRDGCSTLCPGENIYQRLTELRQAVSQNITDCGVNTQLSFAKSHQTISAGERVTFSNTSSGYDRYEWLFEGGSPEVALWQEQGLITYEYPGVFDVSLIGFLAGVPDTAYFADAIVVRGDLTIFPNPISPSSQLTLSGDSTLSKVEIVDSQGSVCYSQNLKSESVISIPSLRAGVYFLRLYSAGFWRTEELIVK